MRANRRRTAHTDISISKNDIPKIPAQTAYLPIPTKTTKSNIVVHEQPNQKTKCSHRYLLDVILFQSQHIAGMSVNKEEPPYAMLAEVVGDTEQRDGGETRLRGHDLELEIPNLVLLSPRKSGELEDKNRKQHADEQESSPRQDQSQQTRLVEAKEGQKLV